MSGLQKKELLCAGLSSVWLRWEPQVLQCAWNLAWVPEKWNEPRRVVGGDMNTMLTHNPGYVDFTVKVVGSHCNTQVSKLTAWSWGLLGVKNQTWRQKDSSGSANGVSVLSGLLPYNPRVLWWQCPHKCKTSSVSFGFRSWYGELEFIDKYLRFFTPQKTASVSYPTKSFRGFQVAWATCCPK